MKSRASLRGKLSSEIPTSSMADIAFLLITFFMVTTVFTAIHGIDYGLPKKETSSNIKPQESVYIHLKASGEITLDFVPVSSMEQLAAYIKGKMEQTQGRKPVILRTDPEVPYGVTVEVLDVLKQLNIQNISIPTQTDIELWKDYFRD